MTDQEREKMAAAFEAKAQNAHDAAMRAGTLLLVSMHDAECETWREAARLLRGTDSRTPPDTARHEGAKPLPIPPRDGR